jgi:hypothetical protein
VVQIILEPIETAIELVEGRIVALRSELDTTPPNTKTLQQVLQARSPHIAAFSASTLTLVMSCSVVVCCVLCVVY